MALVQEDTAAIERWSDENFLIKPTIVQVHAHIEEESSHSSCNSILTPQPHAQSSEHIQVFGCAACLLKILPGLPIYVQSAQEHVKFLAFSTADSTIFQCRYFELYVSMVRPHLYRLRLPCTCVGTTHGQGHP